MVMTPDWWARPRQGDRDVFDFANAIRKITALASVMLCFTADSRRLRPTGDGITARGAWELVKSLSARLGRNIATARSR